MITNEVLYLLASLNGKPTWVGTQEAYNNLDSYDDNTLYFTTGDEETND